MHRTFAAGQRQSLLAGQCDRASNRSRSRKSAYRSRHVQEMGHEDAHNRNDTCADDRLHGRHRIPGRDPHSEGWRPGTAPGPSRDALIARAKSLELNTPYVPPPGDPLEHHTSGFAKIMCSAVFITGLDPDFAAENVGYFTSPYAERAKVGKPVIDRVNKAVHITLPNGVTRTAKYLGDQGCVTLPVGKNSVNFTPVKLKSHLPDASTQPWPMGDVLS